MLSLSRSLSEVCALSSDPLATVLYYIKCHNLAIIVLILMVFILTKVRAMREKKSFEILRCRVTVRISYLGPVRSVRCTQITT